MRSFSVVIPGPEGGGLSIYGTASVSLVNITATGNVTVGGGNGGGIYVGNASDLTIHGSTLSGNTADGFGGGIMIDGTGAYLFNVTVSGNTAHVHGGGIFAAGGGDVLLVHTTITDNHAGLAGGGVHILSRGSAELNVLDIRLGSLALGSDGASIAHGGHYSDQNGDGILGLMLHFPTQDTGVARGDTELCINGETTDGTLLGGCDDIRTVGK